MLLHFDFKLLSLFLFVGIASFVATTPLQGYSVRYVDSHLPYDYDDYIYEAIGMLQMTLEESSTIDVALPKFLTSFKKSHPSDGWEISAACKILILPSEACFIKLDEISTATEINLFSSSMFEPTTSTTSITPSTIITTDTSAPNPPTTVPNSFRENNVNESALRDGTDPPAPPTTTLPTTTPRIPFSVKVTSSNVSNTTFVYRAVGALQLFLEQKNNIPEALPLFLDAYQKMETGYIWKISSQCSTLILSDNAVYIKLLEEYTNTEINLFG